MSNEIEGFALVRFTRKQLQYLRIHGAVLSFQTNERSSSVNWDYCLLGSKVTCLRRKSFTLTLKNCSLIYITLRGKAAKPADWSRVIEQVSQRNLQKEYTVGKKIGEGSFASVHKAVCIETGEEVAVKTVVKRRFDTQMAQALDREGRACALLRIPGVVQTHAIFHTQAKVHIVMDLMSGGTLKERVQDVGGRVAEHVAAPIILETLQTLANLHRLGVAHRDIKMENILCNSQALPTKRTALCDFGYVNFLNPGEETMTSFVGTPVYVAPEILKRKAYGVGVDVWAVGIMLYRMISGFYPFDAGEDDEATLATIIDGDLKFPKDRWQSVSLECISLIRGLLQPKTKSRLSAEGAIQHPWFDKWPLPDGLQAQKEHENGTQSVGAESEHAGCSSLIFSRPSGSKAGLKKMRVVVSAIKFVRRLRNYANVLPPLSSLSSGKRYDPPEPRLILKKLTGTSQPVLPAVSKSPGNDKARAASGFTEASSVGSPIYSDPISDASRWPSGRIPSSGSYKKIEDKTGSKVHTESVLAGSSESPAQSKGNKVRLMLFSWSKLRVGSGRTLRSLCGFFRRI